MRERGTPEGTRNSRRKLPSPEPKEAKASRRKPPSHDPRETRTNSKAVVPGTKGTGPMTTRYRPGQPREPGPAATSDSHRNPKGEPIPQTRVPPWQRQGQPRQAAAPLTPSGEEGTRNSGLPLHGTLQVPILAPSQAILEHSLCHHTPQDPRDAGPIYVF